MRFPWARITKQPRQERSPDDDDVRLDRFGALADTAAPDAAWSGFALAAYRIYADALAAVAPESGTLTAELLSDCGWYVARRGEWLAFIELDEDGSVVLTPCDGWASRGTWTISTRERDGRDSRHLRVPADRVFRVALERRPLDYMSSTSSIVGALDANLAREAIIPPSRLIATTGDLGMLQTVDQRSEITRGVASGGVAVLPHGIAGTGNIMRSGAQPSREALELRAQTRIDVEAMFGIVGLLSHDNEQVALPWQVAVMRTFRPLALRVDTEHRDKIGGSAGLQLDRWDLHTAAERSRGAMQRATAVQRLVAAGMSVEDARAATGL